jgi:hypothetical protein
MEVIISFQIDLHLQVCSTIYYYMFFFAIHLNALILFLTQCQVCSPIWKKAPVNVFSGLDTTLL